MKPDILPPRWARWLLMRLHPWETLEEPGPQVEPYSKTDRAGAVEGDLDELYQDRFNRARKTLATLRYVLNVASVAGPAIGVPTQDGSCRSGIAAVCATTKTQTRRVSISFKPTSYYASVS